MLIINYLLNMVIIFHENYSTMYCIVLIFFSYLCIEQLLVMDSIVKIVIALKLKFLLIILSLGTSYFVEHSAKDKVDPVSAIESIKPDSTTKGSGNIDDRSLNNIADENQGSGLESSDHLNSQPVKYVPHRPFCSQDLEINIVL